MNRQHSYIPDYIQQRDTPQLMQRKRDRPKEVNSQLGIHQQEHSPISSPYSWIMPYSTNNVLENQNIQSNMLWPFDPAK